VHTRIKASLSTALWSGIGLSLMLSLLSCGSGTSSPSGNTAATANGTNVITGIMPASATIARIPAASGINWLAQAFDWFTAIDAAYALSKGRVEIMGTTILAYPAGGGRFELLRVPDGPVTLQVTTPDGETGTISLTLPPGGGAVLDLGHVTVWRGQAFVHYLPSHAHSLYPGFLQARGAVSDLPKAFSSPPNDDVCQTFTVAGLTFCFARHTQFNPPLHALAFYNTSQDGKVAVILAEPSDDPTSTIFRARWIQRNSGGSAATDNTVKAIAPIIGLGQHSITLFRTPLITDNDPATPDLPNKHAITFDTTHARFDPRGLEQHLSPGLVVQIETPKNNRSGPAVTTTPSGEQVADADRVSLFRMGDVVCDKGELIRVTGEVFGPNASTSTFGLTTTSGLVFVQVDQSTRYDEPLTDFGSLTVGRIIEVFALPPQTLGGPLRAVLIDEAAALGEIEARGVISNLDTGAKTFIVSGISFCYDCAGVTTEFVGFESTPLANGQFVEVLGTVPAPGGHSTALRVELETDPRPSSCRDGKGRDDDHS